MNIKRRNFSGLSIKISILLCLLLNLCSVFAAEPSGGKAAKDMKEVIIAKVGNKTISADEFMRRAEYTVRPGFLKGDSPIKKRMVLNSLIAEKLLSMEAGENNEFINNPKVTSYLKGRFEQAMRLCLYNDKVTEKVILDSGLVNRTYAQAGRKYNIKYVSIKDTTVAKQIAEELHNPKLTFEQILTENYSLKNIPERNVSFDASENDKILDSLFSKNVSNGQVIGPVKVETGETIFIKVAGWTDQPAITQDASSKRFKAVEDLYTRRESKKVYENYIREVMKGKEIVFKRDIFFEMAEIFAPVFIITEKKEKSLMKNGYWGTNDTEVKMLKIKPKLESILNKPVFELDNKDWTVGDLLKEMESHPLAFREHKIKTKDFPQELQLAIIDMVRDKFLTQEAYKEGYDKAAFSKREYAMWKDNINFLNERTRILKFFSADTAFGLNYSDVINKHLNKYVKGLQKKYSSIIEINTDELEKIKLMKIDMAATYSGSPFAQVVPNFPIITNYYHLDYGKKMENAKQPGK